MLDNAPEVMIQCPECLGDGEIAHWETVSRWSIDPPCARVETCTACAGVGWFIREAEGD